MQPEKTDVGLKTKHFPDFAWWGAKLHGRGPNNSSGQARGRRSLDLLEGPKLFVYFFCFGTLIL